MLAVENSLRKV